ncbi:hypothetical protein EDD22DRAFT_1050940 [Suillus occidentalis]|nr:hypothetical protein EDD22DRAFT_1050940 [Suillus occidentalis]
MRFSFLAAVVALTVPMFVAVYPEFNSPARLRMELWKKSAGRGKSEPAAHVAIYLCAPVAGFSSFRWELAMLKKKLPLETPSIFVISIMIVIKRPEPEKSILGLSVTTIIALALAATVYTKSTWRFYYPVL